MVEVDCEVEQAAGREHACHLADYLGGAFGVIYDVVAEHNVERLVCEGESLAARGDCTRATLPSGEERCVVARERVNARAARRAEVEDESVRAAPDFEYARVCGDGPKLFETRAHACRARAHRGDVLVLVARGPQRLRTLVGELSFERAPRPRGPRRLDAFGSSRHLVAQNPSSQPTQNSSFSRSAHSINSHAAARVRQPLN